MKKYNKFIKYVFFACLTTVINVGSYYLMYRFVTKNIIICNIVAYALSITAQFFTNKHYVFENKEKTRVKQIVLFLITKLIAFTLDTAVLYVCTKVFKWDNLLSKIISNSSTTISNYTLNNKWVFRNEDKSSSV